jgi:hypothetical protein
MTNLEHAQREQAFDMLVAQETWERWRQEKLAVDPGGIYAQAHLARALREAFLVGWSIRRHGLDL